MQFFFFFLGGGGWGREGKQGVLWEMCKRPIKQEIWKVSFSTKTNFTVVF